MKYNSRKFLTFPINKQHKKCAELLRQIFQDPSSELFNHYNEIQSWMKGEPLNEADPKVVSDR